MLTRCEVTGGGFSRVFTHRTALCLPRFSLKHWGENHPQHFPMMKEDFGLWLVRMSQWFQCCSDNSFFFFFDWVIQQSLLLHYITAVSDMKHPEHAGLWLPCPPPWNHKAVCLDECCKLPIRLQSLMWLTLQGPTARICCYGNQRSYDCYSLWGFFFFLLQHHLVFYGLCAIIVEWSIKWLLSSTGYHRGLMFVCFCGGCLQDHRKRKGELFLLTVKISGTHWCVANNSATRCLWDVSGCNMNHIIVTKLISTLTSSSLP